MTSEDLRNELSIAGSPEKIMQIYGTVWDYIRLGIDWTNPGEIINIHFVLRRMEAEVKLALKRLEKRTGQKYKL